MMESNKTIVYTCPYVPAEWIAAHGLRPRRLIPGPMEGASVIPRLEGLCPYARAFVNDISACGDAEGIVVTTMCDQMRRVFDLLVRRVEVPAFLLNVPSTWQTAAAQRLYLDELKRLGRFLARLGGRDPSRKELARVLLESDAAEWNSPDAIAGHGTPCDGQAVPLAIVGGPLMQRDRVLFGIVQDCGGRIVLDATETGQRGRHAPFNRRRIAEDPLLELAETYFRIPDASRRPNSELYRWLKDELVQTGARGIVFHYYLWCDKWRAEFARLKDWTGLPALGLDSDGEGTMEVVRLRNRVRAFLETFA